MVGRRSQARWSHPTGLRDKIAGIITNRRQEGGTMVAAIFRLLPRMAWRAAVFPFAGWQMLARWLARPKFAGTSAHGRRCWLSALVSVKGKEGVFRFAYTPYRGGGGHSPPCEIAGVSNEFGSNDCAVDKAVAIRFANFPGHTPVNRDLGLLSIPPQPSPNTIAAPV